jgi:hypothetical protein
VYLGESAFSEVYDGFIVFADRVLAPLLPVRQGGIGTDGATHWEWCRAAKSASSLESLHLGDEGSAAHSKGTLLPCLLKTWLRTAYMFESCSFHSFRESVAWTRSCPIPASSSPDSPSFLTKQTSAQRVLYQFSATQFGNCFQKDCFLLFCKRTELALNLHRSWTVTKQ